MTILIAVVAVNLLAWLALACTARWQRTPDQQRTPGQMRTSSSDVAVGGHR